MDTIYLAGIIIVVLVAGFFAVLHGKKKGWITEDVLETIDADLDMVRLLVDVVDYEKLDKEKATFGLDLADIATDFVSGVYGEHEDRHALSARIVSETLTKLGKTATKDEQKLIDIVIDKSLKIVEKQEKE